MKLRRSSHSVYQCLYHLVWSTKYRKRVLTESWQREYCEAQIRRAAAEFGMWIYNIEVDRDHVHLEIEIPPQRSVGSAVRILKSVSARLMFKKIPSLKKMLWAGELWGDGYFVRTIGDEVTAAMVQRYIKAHAFKGLEPAQGELFREKKLPRSQ